MYVARLGSQNSMGCNNTDKLSNSLSDKGKARPALANYIVDDFPHLP